MNKLIMTQDPQTALPGKSGGRQLLDRDLAYAYGLLCVGCYASYLGAPLIMIIAVAIALALPQLLRPKRVSPAEVGAHAVVALSFAAIAHMVGWGIAGAVGS